MKLKTITTYFIKRGIAKLTNAYRGLPVRPFRKFFRKIYLKHIENKMFENRLVVAERGGIKYRLDLSNSQDNEVYYDGCFEPTVVKIIQKYVKPGMTVFDIGAHAGGHALRLAKLVGADGKVIAVEPAPAPLLKFKENLELNDFHNVIVENISFSDINLASTIVTLDEYVRINQINRVDFIKMDTDGCEYKIISGGINSLKKFKPIIVAEFTRTGLERQGDSLDGLIDLLSSLGYAVCSDINLKEYPNRKSILDSVPYNTASNVLLRPKCF